MIKLGFTAGSHVVRSRGKEAQQHRAKIILPYAQKFEAKRQK